MPPPRGIRLAFVLLSDIDDASSILHVLDRRMRRDKYSPHVDGQRPIKQRRRREIGEPRAAPGAALGQHKKRGLALKVRDNCGPYTPVLNQIDVGWHY